MGLFSWLFKTLKTEETPIEEVFPPEQSSRIGKYYGFIYCGSCPTVVVVGVVDEMCGFVIYNIWHFGPKLNRITRNVEFKETLHLNGLQDLASNFLRPSYYLPEVASKEEAVHYLVNKYPEKRR